MWKHNLHLHLGLCKHCKKMGLFDMRRMMVVAVLEFTSNPTPNKL